MKISRMVTWR